jgi:hypothetical protein
MITAREVFFGQTCRLVNSGAACAWAPAAGACACMPEAMSTTSPKAMAYGMGEILVKEHLDKEVTLAR